MKVALVYDRVNKWGGAERVLLSLHEMFPDAPLFTSVYHPSHAPWAKKMRVIPSFLQRIPFAPSNHEAYPYLMPIAFENFTFDGYDLVISLTSEAAKGVLTKPHTKHICICLTPTRYLWSGYKEYFSNPIFRMVTKPVVSYLKWWDVTAAQRPDAFIAISQEVQRRIQKYYCRSSTVIYPSVELQAAKMPSVRTNSVNQPYFLIVSRLVPYKRIDIAVEACNALSLPLKIIGSGSEEAQLQKLAGPTVEFLGNLTDEEVIRYYSSCLGLLFPGHEDLGLSIIEVQKFGRPAIAFRAGGALETIIEGKTGIFFYPQTTRALAQTLKAFWDQNASLTPAQYDKKYKEACIRQAEKFSKERFKRNITFFIEKVLQ